MASSSPSAPSTPEPIIPDPKGRGRAIAADSYVVVDDTDDHVVDSTSYYNDDYRHAHGKCNEAEYYNEHVEKGESFEGAPEEEKKKASMKALGGGSSNPGVVIALYAGGIFGLWKLQGYLFGNTNRTTRFAFSRITSQIVTICGLVGYATYRAYLTEDDAAHAAPLSRSRLLEYRGDARVIQSALPAPRHLPAFASAVGRRPLKSCTEVESGANSLSRSQWW